MPGTVTNNWAIVAREDGLYFTYQGDRVVKRIFFKPKQQKDFNSGAGGAPIESLFKQNGWEISSENDALYFKNDDTKYAFYAKPNT